MDVFLSYAREDREAARQVQDALQRSGYDTWIDRDLRGGQRWWDVIIQRIRSCDVFMVFLSPDSARSEACLKEIEDAVNTERPLVPVMVRETDVNSFPTAVSEVVCIDYTSGDIVEVLSALRVLPEETPLPDDLPPPPDAPGADWEVVRTKSVAERRRQHRFTAPGVEPLQLAARLEDWLATQHMKSQVLRSADGTVVVKAEHPVLRGPVSIPVEFDIRTEGDELVVQTPGLGIQGVFFARKAKRHLESAVRELTQSA